MRLYCIGFVEFFFFFCIAARFGLVTERVRLVLSLLILIKVSIPIEFLSVY